MFMGRLAPVSLDHDGMDDHEARCGFVWDRCGWLSVAQHSLVGLPLDPNLIMMITFFWVGLSMYELSGKLLGTAHGIGFTTLSTDYIILLLTTMENSTIDKPFAMTHQKLVGWTSPLSKELN